MKIVEKWLEGFARLDELITAKKSEILQASEMMFSSSGSDGMPHAQGKSDRTGNIAVKLVSLESDLLQLYSQKEAKLYYIEQLPTAEYGVLHRLYVRRMTQERAAAEMGYSTVQVWRIKKRAIAMLEEILIKEKGGQAE